MEEPGMKTWLGILVLAVGGFAQTVQSPMASVGKANLPAQAVGPYDLLAVSVYRSPELTRTIRVAADGTIGLPLLKGRIEAAGLMPEELAERIAEALKQERILVDPIVEVTVAEYASRPISVMGAVRRPLTFQASGRVTLLDALARAEGLTEDAAAEILVTLPADPDEESGGAARRAPVVRRIPVKGLIDEARPEWNLELHGGEVIRVPEAGKIFVVGNVRRPGGYAVPDPEDATVLKLIALAEGLTPYYRKKAYIYRRDPATGVKREIEIELGKIMKREAPDVPLRVNDILYIPDHASRRVRAKVIDRVTGFGTATVSGILIWGRR